MQTSTHIMRSKARDRHLYAVGRIRAMENTLLDRDILRNLVEAPTLKDVYQELRDTVYGEGIVETEENLDFERMLNLETQSLIRLIDSISPDPELTDLFVFFYDVQNLKIFFKARLGNAPEPKSFYTIGRFSLDTLRQLVSSPEVTILHLPSWITDAAEELRKAWKDYPKLRIVDAVFDRALARAQLAGAKKAKRAILVRYFSFIVDVHNVEAFIRISIMERSRRQFEQFFVPGGDIPLSFFQAIKLRTEAQDTESSSRDITAALHEIGRHFENTPFHDMVTKSIEEYQAEGTLTMLDMEQSRLLREQLAPSRYITFGPEPILAYLVTRIFEIRLLRRIMVAKKTNLSIEDLRKRVMSVYA